MQSKGCGDRPPAAITAMTVSVPSVSPKCLSQVSEHLSQARSYSDRMSGRLRRDAPEHAAIDVRGMPDGPRNALCERLFVADKT